MNSGNSSNFVSSMLNVLGFLLLLALCVTLFNKVSSFQTAPQDAIFVVGNLVASLYLLAMIIMCAKCQIEKRAADYLFAILLLLGLFAENLVYLFVMHLSGHADNWAYNLFGDSLSCTVSFLLVALKTPVLRGLRHISTSTFPSALPYLYAVSRHTKYHTYITFLLGLMVVESLLFDLSDMYYAIVLNVPATVGIGEAISAAGYFDIYYIHLSLMLSLTLISCVLIVRATFLQPGQILQSPSSKQRFLALANQRFARRQ